MSKPVEIDNLYFNSIVIKGIANRVKNKTTDIIINTTPNLNFQFFFIILKGLQSFKVTKKMLKSIIETLKPFNFDPLFYLGHNFTLGS